MRISVQSDRGLVREQNEDYVGVWELPGNRGLLFAVADGMGGHERGEVASSLAVITLWDTFRKGDGREPAELMEEAFRKANQRIYRLARRRRHIMGTTLTAALIHHPEGSGEAELVVGHVGDSKAYLLRGGAFRQLSRDHSVVGELLRNGGLSEWEARKHPQRHVLTRALGVEWVVEVDVHRERLWRGDMVVLATDGLTNLVSTLEIRELLLSGREDFPSLAPRLCRLANDRGGYDNVSVVAVEF